MKDPRFIIMYRATLTYLSLSGAWTTMDVGLLSTEELAADAGRERIAKDDWPRWPGVDIKLDVAPTLCVVIDEGWANAVHIGPPIKIDSSEEHRR